tara:strand:- start:29361 stop:29651 length:291 start_codon:yes stop_codon:yes gene_type:complete
MLKSELIKQLSIAHKDVPVPLIEKSVNRIFSVLTDALEKGRTVEIRGFGTMGITVLKPRQCRNPKTGEHFQAKQKRKVYWRTGKGLNERINASVKK